VEFEGSYGWGSRKNDYTHSLRDMARDSSYQNTAFSTQISLELLIILAL